MKWAALFATVSAISFVSTGMWLLLMLQSGRIFLLAEAVLVLLAGTGVGFAQWAFNEFEFVLHQEADRNEELQRQFDAGQEAVR